MKKLPWLVKWALKQTFGTRKGNQWINYIETDPIVQTFWNVLDSK